MSEQRITRVKFSNDDTKGEVLIWAEDLDYFTKACRERGFYATDIIEQPLTVRIDIDRTLNAWAEEQ